jgi:hypothetical protein
MVWYVWLTSLFTLGTFNPCTKWVLIFGCQFLNHYLTISWTSILKWHGFACVILATFNLIVERWWITQSFASSKPRWLLFHSFHLLTQNKCVIQIGLQYLCITFANYRLTTFLFLIVPLKWFESEVKGMFRYMLAFVKEVSPFCIASNVSSSCWFVHLLCLNALGILLIFVKLCVVIVDDQVIGPFVLVSWQVKIVTSFVYCCGKLGSTSFLCCWGW